MSTVAFIIVEMPINSNVCVPPITTEDLSNLPDNTELIELILDSDEVWTVVPRFIGTGETGRFVTGYFKISDNTISIHARRSQNGIPGELEFIEDAELDERPVKVGEIWDQTLFFEEPDAETLEWLREAINYEMTWMSKGEDPKESFIDWADEPFSHKADGLPECAHSNLTSHFKPPNLDIGLVCCNDCEIPLAVKTGEGSIYTYEDIGSTDFLGLPEPESNHQIRIVPVERNNGVSNSEIVLHFMLRLAMIETDFLDLYARGEQNGMLICMGNATVGYAMWSEVGDYIALQQRYIHSAFRRKGLGTILLKAWYDYVDVDWYYTIRSNVAARRSLKSAGHLQDNIARPATMLGSRDSLDPANSSPGFVDRMTRESVPGLSIEDIRDNL